MNPATKLYRNIYDLVLDVKEQLRKQGFVVPSKQANGAIKIGHYTIIKEEKIYAILDKLNRKVVQGINLPHTAIVIANNLELGRTLDHKLIEADQQYGYANFEEEHFKKIADSAVKKQDWDRFDTLSVKKISAKKRADEARRIVLGSYEKLRRPR